MEHTPRGQTPDGARRTFWFDPRFAIGLVLIIGSVAGVVGVIAVNDSSERVLAARGAIAPGQTLTSSDLVTVQVRVGDATGLYLAPTDLPDNGVVATRAIAAGEFIPASAVGDVGGLDLTAVVLTLTSPLPESVQEGSRLDVWSARAEGSGEFAAPTVIVSGATAQRVIEQDGLMASNSATLVEVLIPRSAVAGVLENVANGAALSAIPVDLPVEG